MYIYPDNLRAKATLWLWQLRDVAIIGVAFLLSVLALAQTGSMIPLVGTVLYAFLSIQVEGSSVLDFLRRAEMCIRDRRRPVPKRWSSTPTTPRPSRCITTLWAAWSLSLIHI